jgi:hypothetical protein
MPSTISEAVSEIDDFLSRETSSLWQLEKSEVASRLKELVEDPSLIQQGNLNLCGPATTFHLWLKRDPLAFSQYCIQLFEQGEATIGNIIVKPDSDLVKQKYSDVLPRMKETPCPQAEWMAMSALRDSANTTLDFEGTPEEDASGITLPSEIEEWLVATGLYSSVQNEGNFVLNAGLEHAMKLRPELNQDIVMLINATMISESQGSLFDVIASRFPNHYISLNAAIEFYDDKIFIDYWTWGGNKKNEIDKSIFEDNYFGAVIASF